MSAEQTLERLEKQTRAWRWFLGGAMTLLAATAAAVMSYAQVVGRLENLDRYGSGWTQEQIRRLDAENAKRDQTLWTLVETVRALRDDVLDARQDRDGGLR